MCNWTLTFLPPFGKCGIEPCHFSMVLQFSYSHCYSSLHGRTMQCTSDDHPLLFVLLCFSLVTKVTSSSCLLLASWFMRGQYVSHSLCISLMKSATLPISWMISEGVWWKSNEVHALHRNNFFKTHKAMPTCLYPNYTHCGHFIICICTMSHEYWLMCCRRFFTVI